MPILTLSCNAHVAVYNALAMTFSENSSDRVALKGDDVTSLSREETSPSETEVWLLTVLVLERVERAGLSSSDSLSGYVVTENIFSAGSTRTRHKWELRQIS